jgi:hypothetical protein
MSRLPRRTVLGRAPAGEAAATVIPRGSARTAGIPAGGAAGIRAAIPAGPPYRRSPAGAAIPTRRQASVRSHHRLGSSRAERTLSGTTTTLCER